MRAARCTEYGPPEVVTVADLPDPQPRRGEVLVRVIETTVSAGDSRIRGARFPRGFGPFARAAFGITRPRRPVLGNTFSGVVDAVGAEVRGVRVGQVVCGTTGSRLGTHAELVAVPGERIVPVPEGVSHRDAAGVLFGGTTAVHFLRHKASVRPGDRVLVNGASGAVGSNVVQVATELGAKVTAVTSGRNAQTVRELGAADVIDYTTTDLAGITDRFELVVDTVGTLDARSGRRLLADGGTVLLVAADLWQTIGARGNVKAGPAAERPDDVRYLLDLVRQGSLRAVVDEVYPLDDIVAAHRRVDTGRKVGNVMLTVSNS